MQGGLQNVSKGGPVSVYEEKQVELGACPWRQANLRPGVGSALSCYVILDEFLNCHEHQVPHLSNGGSNYIYFAVLIWGLHIAHFLEKRMRTL